MDKAQGNNSVDSRYIELAKKIIEDLEEVHALRGDIVQDELELLIAHRIADFVENMKVDD